MTKYFEECGFITEITKDNLPYRPLPKAIEVDLCNQGCCGSMPMTSCGCEGKHEQELPHGNEADNKVEDTPQPEKPQEGVTPATGDKHDISTTDTIIPSGSAGDTRSRPKVITGIIAT